MTTRNLLMTRTRSLRLRRVGTVGIGILLVFAGILGAWGLERYRESSEAGVSMAQRVLQLCILGGPGSDELYAAGVCGKARNILVRDQEGPPLIGRNKPVGPPIPALPVNPANPVSPVTPGNPVLPPIPGNPSSPGSPGSPGSPALTPGPVSPPASGAPGPGPPRQPPATETKTETVTVPPPPPPPPPTSEEPPPPPSPSPKVEPSQPSAPEVSPTE